MRDSERETSQYGEIFYDGVFCVCGAQHSLNYIRLSDVWQMRCYSVGALYTHTPTWLRGQMGALSPPAHTQDPAPALQPNTHYTGCSEWFVCID